MTYDEIRDVLEKMSYGEIRDVLIDLQDKACINDITLVCRLDPNSDKRSVEENYAVYRSAQLIYHLIQAKRFAQALSEHEHVSKIPPQ